MTLLSAPMEGLLDFVLRDVPTRVGGVDRCVSEFIRIIGTLLPDKVFLRYVPEVYHGGRTLAGVPARALDFTELQSVLQQRCVQCHGAQVQMKGLRLDSPEQVAPRAQLIYQQVVLQKLMPINNATQMTEAERALIARWHAAGGSVQ